jgi:hypothetical protein
LKLKGNEDHHHHYHPCKRKRTRMNSHAIPNYTYYPKVTRSKSKLLQNPQNPQKNLTPLNPYPIHNHPNVPRRSSKLKFQQEYHHPQMDSHSNEAFTHTNSTYATTQTTILELKLLKN